MFVREHNRYNSTNITTVSKGTHNACKRLKLKCSFANSVRYNTGLSNQYLMIYKVKRMILYVKSEKEIIGWNESRKCVYSKFSFFFFNFEIFKNDIDEITYNTSISMVILKVK